MVFPGLFGTDDIEASLDKGVLAVQAPMPRAAERETKRITIAR
ncbi:Hsp20 family protein [Spirillospora albida]|nr:Hsp20 family protein [Spirillospora albida]